ncbi:4a-hydroxytetrahydrobiopterin dehydratase [Marinobacter sp. C2H3]|uniref:4a-hydroxytetrahydrobiopterin dehydratase n=1 Tax=Marinobacter sp. C2H3 TaxID=3119003 RepID=UPI00300EA7DA
MDLKDEVLKPCPKGTPILTPEEQQALLATMTDWSVTQQDGEDQFIKTFRTKDFAGALALANRIGELAEAEDHHPTLEVSWGKVTVRWWTHAIGGLHRNDAIMAARTDALA